MILHRLHINTMLTLSMVFVFLGAWFLPASADIGGLTFNVTLGFSGYFYPGAWVPVQVEVANDGFPVEAAVEAVTRQSANSYSSNDVRYVFRRAVSLPTGSHKRIYINLPISDIWKPLDVRLVQADGTVLATSRLTLRTAGVYADIVLVLDNTGERWTWLQEAVQAARSETSKARVYVVHSRSAQDLPADWVAYESIRTVILTDSFPMATLAEPQVTALLQWVEAGGHLVVVGGAALDAAQAPALAAALPVKLTGGTVTANISGLGSGFDLFAQKISTPCWGATAGAGEVMAASAGLPLVAYSSHGAGRISYLACDISTPAFRNWTDFDYFSRDLVFPQRVVRKATTRSLENSLLPMLLSLHIPYPKHIWMTIFLAIYIALIAFTLQQTRTRRRFWLAWAGVNFLSCLCVVSVINPIINRHLHAYAEIKVSQVPPTSGAAHSVSVAQVMDMRGGYWAVERTADTYIAPALSTQNTPGSIVQVEQSADAVTLGPVAPRQAQALTSHTLADIPIRVKVSYRNYDMNISVANATKWLLHTAFFVDRERYYYIGDIPAGEERATSFPSDQFVISSTSLSPEWIAASVAAVARQKDTNVNERERQALTKIVEYALTPDESSYLPWGRPLVIGILAAPVAPPLTSSFTGVGYHFIVIPLGSIAR